MTLRAARFGLVVVLYAAAAAACTFPLVLHLSDALLPTPDPLHSSWILAWDIHALTTDPLHLYDGNIFYPFPLSLTYSDSMLSGALTVAPLFLISGNAILAHNVLTLASFTIAGLGMYVLVRELTGSEWGAFIGGCVFSFCAARQGHLDHVNLLQFGWLPLALLCLHRAVRSGRTSDLVLFAVLTAWQTLASLYLAYMMAVAYAVFFAFELAARRGQWKIGNMLRVAGALVLAAIVVVPLEFPYAITQRIYQFNWPTNVLGDLSAVPTDFLSVPPQNLVYSAVLGQFTIGPFFNEHTLFPGFVAVALTLVALLRRPWSAEIVRYALIGGVALILSFGPALRLDSQHEALTLPYAFLLRFVPGFGAMRAPARFDFLVMLAIAVLSGFGIARISRALPRWSGAVGRRSILLAIGALALLELVPRPPGTVPINVGAAVPPVYAWLRTQDPSGVVAEIPAQGRTGYASLGYEYMSTYHWHPLVNGGSAFDPAAYKQIVARLDAFPDPAAVEDLRSLGVRYIVAHQDDLDEPQRQRLDAIDLAQLQLGIAARFGGDLVYVLDPRADQPAQLDARLDLPSLVARGNAPWATATLSNPTSRPLVLGLPGALATQVQWNQDAPSTPPPADVPVFVEPDRQVSLHVPADLPQRLTTTDSAQLTVRLTGAVHAEGAQMVRFADLPTSLDTSGLSAAVERVQLPPRVHAGSRMPVDVSVRNTGHAVWLADPAGTTGTPGVVGIAVRRWIASDGIPLPASENSSAHVQWNVNPGQATSMSLVTSAPAGPGQYTLVLEMLSEQVAWFADVNGGEATRLTLDVEP